MIKKDNSEIFLTFIEKSVGVRLNGMRNLPAIRDWCRQTGLIDEFQQAKWLEKISIDPKIRMYSICRGDKVVGVCGLTDIDHLNQRAEFSLYIFPKQQKQGYAKVALHLLLAHGFGELNLRTIWGETFVGNPAMKLFQAMGFQLEGRRRNFYFKNGRFLDADLISMTREEFENGCD